MKVVAYQEFNLMSPAALGIVFGPSIIRKGDDFTPDLLKKKAEVWMIISRRIVLLLLFFCPCRMRVVKRTATYTLRLHLLPHGNSPLVINIVYVSFFPPSLALLSIPPSRIFSFLRLRRTLFGMGISCLIHF